MSLPIRVAGAVGDCGFVSTGSHCFSWGVIDGLPVGVDCVMSIRFDTNCWVWYDGGPSIGDQLRYSRLLGERLGAKNIRIGRLCSQSLSGNLFHGIYGETRRLRWQISCGHLSTSGYTIHATKFRSMYACSADGQFIRWLCSRRRWHIARYKAVDHFAARYFPLRAFVW
jgi:hypothetical protein